MELRRFSRDDWSWVQAWFKDRELNARLGPMDNEWLEAVLSEREGAQFVLIDEDVPVALLGCVWDAQGPNPHVVTDIAVAPGKTGRGYASEAIRRLMGSSAIPPAHRWAAWVEPDNTKARALMTRLQWSECGIDPNNAMIRFGSPSCQDLGELGSKEYSMVFLTDASDDDVAEMSAGLFEIAAAGKRISPCDPDFVRTQYIDDPCRLNCSVARDEDGTLLGFQSLKRAEPGNRYGAPVGSGVIGTHIRPLAARRGVGRTLFATTHAAARAAGLAEIEAFIAADNPEARAYYGAMGFVTRREPEGAVVEVFSLAQSNANA